MSLKLLTDLDGVSGNEGAVRAYILEKIQPFADSVTVDAMGNVVAFKRGKQRHDKKILVCAHMDEVGLIVSGITDDGYLKFQAVGGVDDRILLSQRVRIGAQQIPGVIGVKAVHLQSREERKNVIKIEDLYIDIGARDKSDAMKSVGLGDYAAFDSEYRELGSCVKAKAIDDRAGCLTLLHCIQKQYDSDLYFCFSVQEETGLRGARVLAHRLQADMAIVFEATTAADVPFLEPHQQATQLGGGPAISIMDRASCSNKALNQWIVDTAEAADIPFQWKRTTFGGNDAGSLATAGGACATAAISLPCRYLHSPVSMANKKDLEAMQRLADCLLTQISQFDGKQKG